MNKTEIADAVFSCVFNVDACVHLRMEYKTNTGISLTSGRSAADKTLNAAFEV